jgi:phage-related protein
MDGEHLSPVRWVGSSLKDLKSFPSEVKAEVGHALYVRHVLPSNGATISVTLTPPKPFSGLAAGSVAPCCATVYTVRFRGFVYVLHAFQKKSKSGIATPKKDIDLIHQRLAAAKRDYEGR